MKLSTRARYGVRLMLALARSYGQGSVYLKDVAKGEEISEKYLSQIIIPLRSAGLVNSSRGVYGGYMLSKSPAEITLKQIVEPLEGDCLVDCVKNPSACTRVPTCASRDVWALLGSRISETLEGITLEHLVEMQWQRTVKSGCENQGGPELKKKVLVAMSGGVDSSVAAFLLKEQGYEPAGVTMDLGVRNAGAANPRCCGSDVIRDARRVCDRLGLPHYVFDYKKLLEENVVRPFVAEYARGRTPNPCVDCNHHLKFGALLNRAKALGFDYLATGHYADIEQRGNGFVLKRPKDRQKDQTYFLYRIAPDALGSILFPLASYTKDEVREMAVKVHLPVEAKGESQDICFVTQKNYQAFFTERLRDIKPGWIVDQDGKKLGEHRGIVFYTIGQRGGLGISHKAPLYVVAIDAMENRIVVGEKRDLWATGLTAGDLNMLSLDWPRTVHVKIRYRKQEAPCTVAFENDRIHAVFADRQEAVTPGQSAVFYDEDRVLGGGIIEKSIGATTQRHEPAITISGSEKMKSGDE